MDVVSRTEYNQLENHLANITEELHQERIKLTKLAGLRSRSALEGVKFVLADVITDSLTASQSELIINRGGDDGLAVGQYVLGDNSIIGTISGVSSRTAEVRLITDSESKIPVTIAGLEVSRVMQGDGGESAKIQMLAMKHEVRSGQVIYASKKPGFLETPMIVGRVYACGRDDENPSIWDVTVKPACNIENLNDVAVLIMNP
jgi:rod shape-determining protein MreC